MADKNFIVEAVFRARDEISRTIGTIETNASKLGRALTSGPIASAGRPLDDLTNKTNRLGAALSSGNFKAASTEVNKVAQSFSALGAAVSSGNITGAAAAAGQLSASFGGTAQATATLAKELVKVEKLGIASAAGLRLIQGAASEADIGLKLVASGLTNFRARVIAAASGTGAAAAAFRTLGASNEQIKTGFGSTANALAFASAGIANMKDEAAQAAAATTLFGGAGKKLVPIMGELAAAETTAAAASAGLSASLAPVAIVVGTVLAALVGLVVAVKSVQAVISAGVEGAAYADSLGDIAEKAGLTTEEVSRLAFVASQSDTSVGELATGLKFLSKNLVAAREEGSEANLAFRALGFSNEELKGGLVNSRESFLRLADAVAATRDPMEKTAIATAVLGRGGEALIPTLNRASSGIRALEQESDAARATISGLQSEVGDKFEKATKKLNLQMLALKAAIGEDVVPEMTKLVTAASEVVLGIRAITDDIALLGRGFKDLSGVDPSVAFKAIGAAVVAVTPILREFVTLLQFVRGFAPPKVEPPKRGKEFEDVKTGQDVSAEEIHFSQAVAALKAEDEAHKKAAEAAAKHAEELLKLRAAYDKAVEGANNLDVPREAARIFFELDPESAVKTIQDLQKVIDEAKKEAEKATIVVPVGVQFQKPKLDDFGNLPGQATIKDTAPLPEDDRGLADRLVIANGAALDLVATFEDMGIPVDALKESLAVIGADLTSIGAIGIGVSASLREGLSEVFDPTKVAISGTLRAVGELGQQFDQLGSAAINRLIPATTAFRGMAGSIDLATRAMLRFVAQISVAIAKALILKVITTALGLSGGGKVADVGTGAAYKASGGTIAPHFAFGGGLPLVPPVRRAFGGSIARLQGFAMGGPVHAAYGLAVPGGPSWRDSVPAVLSPGEFVAPNYGTQTGTQIIKELAGGVAVMREVVKVVTGPAGAGGSGGGAPMIGTVVIHANDADSVRHAVRPGGEFEREMARAAELGRARW